MKKMPFVLSVLAVLALAVPVLAQDQGPSQDEINQEAAQAESQMRQESGGGPPPIEVGNDEMGPSGQPNIPGAPPEARKLLGDKPIVEIYCLMTKWKTGEFFAMLDAVGTNLKPATDKAKDLDVEVAFPNLDDLRSRAQTKIDAVCSAATVDEADANARSFTTFGEEVRAQFAAMRADLEKKMRAKGDELRDKVEREIAPIVASEKARVEEEMKSWAESQARSMNESLQSEVESKGFASAEEATSYVQSRVGSVKSSLTSQIQAKVAEQKKLIQAKIQAKVEEIVGPERKKLEDVGAAFKDMGTKINAGIQSGKAKYDTYRDQAFAKRKAAALSLVDAQLDKAKAELEKNRAEFDKLKKEDPSVKGIDEILAEMNADRAGLDSKLDRALAAEDDAAFEAALNDFRNKWEKYRDESEKAFMSPARVCGIVRAQVTAARPQIQNGLKQIDGLVQSCVDNSANPGCDKVQALAARFGTITDKLTGIDNAMTRLEGLCQQSEASGTLAPDIMKLLDQLKVDGLDAKAYGQALEAEKAAALADAEAQAKQGCTQAMTRIEAGRLELAEGMKDLDAQIKECAATPAEPQCAAIGQVKSRVAKINADAAQLEKKTTSLVNACAKVGKGAMPEDLMALFTAWNSQRGEIDSTVKDLKYEASKVTTVEEVCGFARPAVEAGNRELADLMTLMRQKRVTVVASGEAKCAKDPGAEGCPNVTMAVNYINELEGLFKSYSTSFWGFTKLCAAKTTTRSEAIAAAQALRKQAYDFKALGKQYQTTLETVEETMK